MLEATLSQIESVLRGGGFVIWPLAVASVVLWYALGERAFILRRSRATASPELLENPPRAPRDLLGIAALRIKNRTATRGELRMLLDEDLSDLVSAASRHRSLIRSLVMVAPLLGLLGTVSGMIETFDALADMALFSQSGGVAGGVSQALISTQVGLTVAIPGLVLGRLLDKKERTLVEELEILKDIASASVRGEER